MVRETIKFGKLEGSKVRFSETFSTIFRKCGQVPQRAQGPCIKGKHRNGRKVQAQALRTSFPWHWFSFCFRESGDECRDHHLTDDADWKKWRKRWKNPLLEEGHAPPKGNATSTPYHYSFLRATIYVLLRSTTYQYVLRNTIYYHVLVRTTRVIAC